MLGPVRRKYEYFLTWLNISTKTRSDQYLDGVSVSRFFLKVALN